MASNIVDGKIALQGIFDKIKGSAGYVKTIKVFKDDKQLCFFTLTDRDKYSVAIDAAEQYLVPVMDSLRMSGITDLAFTFTDTSNPFDIKQENESTLKDIAFTNWFRAISLEKVLVPDTDAILNHQFSSLELSLGSEILTNTRIMIPRLVLLELERQMNCTTDLLKKRRIMLGFSEIMYLKTKNTDLFPDLENELLVNFSKITTDFSADAWIRREVNRYPISIAKQTQVGESSAVLQKPPFLLITSDMINSLSCIAENIDTLYISKTENGLGGQVGIATLIAFLLNLGVLLQEIKVTINSETYQLIGFWNGISTRDLMNGRISLSPVGSTTY